jgi:hypothetical protein
MFGEHINNERPNRCADGEGSNEGNHTFVKRLKVGDCNRKCDTNETDDYSTVMQCSEITGSVDLPKTIPIETRSYGEYKNNHEDEIDYTGSFSWLINFNVGSLFSVHESQQQVEETACQGMC